MRRPDLPLALAIFISAGMAGCATSSLEMAPERPDRPWQPETTATGDIVPGAPKPASAAGKNGYALPSNSALAAVPPGPALDPAHAYSLPELIDIAESANPLTRVAWNDARNAALAAGIAKSAYLPQISAAALGGYQSGHSSTSADVGSVSANGSIHGAVSVLSLQWLLFDFGERSGLVEAAEQASVIANIGFTAVHQQVIHDVSVAFYVYDAARSRTGAAKQSLDNAGAILAAAQARYRHGIGTVVEVAQATQNGAQANLALVQAQGAENDAYLSLISATGLSPLSHPRIGDLPIHPLSPALRKSIDQIVDTAIAQRPDVLSAYAAEKANLGKVKAAEAEFMPKIFMSAYTSYASGGSSITAIPSVGQQAPTVNLSNNHYGASIFLGVTIPLYDGGLRSAVLAQARNDADNAATRLTRTKEEAVRQIAAGQNALESSLAANDAAKALVAAAQTTYNAAFAAYRHGVGSITDVMLAQNQLLLAKNTDVDSYSGALAAAATLALATGSIGTMENQPRW